MVAQSVSVVGGYVTMCYATASELFRQLGCVSAKAAVPQPKSTIGTCFTIGPVPHARDESIFYIAAAGHNDGYRQGQWQYGGYRFVGARRSTSSFGILP